MLLALSIVLALLSAAIIIDNWRRAIRGAIGLPSGSWSPLLGGVLGAAAIALWPRHDIGSWWWVPLVIDFGSLPGLAWTAWWLLVRRERRPDDQRNPDP